ncbi:MAG: MBL fold metallo-hydrolase [Firmicutes bacterium]|nr:MBL fold metallo-hydrolase [Bacillota bacterium]
MRITYYGHSCFTLESQGFRVVVDPYRDYVPGYRALHLEADAVFCSHGHDDHAWVQAVTIRENAPADPFTVTEVAGFHDDAQGAKRGPNTMRIFEAEGLKAVHLGDIGCMPPEADLEKLKGADVCLVPVGGFYTIDAVQAKALMDILQPKIVIPMHFRLGDMGFAEIGTLDEFTKLYAPESVCFPGTNTLELTKETPAGVTVLQYM